MNRIIKFIKNFICFSEFSWEWLWYFIIILALIAFFIVSCYNADRLIRFHDEDTDIRDGLNVAIECVIILVGFCLFAIWRQREITKLQLCFCGHISIFLILTGAAAMAATSKRIEQAGFLKI
jgi:hypothetical protein